MISAILTSTRLFPCSMIFLSICASVRYTAADDVGKAIYWALAAGLTFTVTFLMKG